MGFYSIVACQLCEKTREEEISLEIHMLGDSLGFVVTEQWQNSRVGLLITSFTVQ